MSFSAARRVPVPRIAQLGGLPITAVEAILRGAPWRHLATSERSATYSRRNVQSRREAAGMRYRHPSGAPAAASQCRAKSDIADSPRRDRSSVAPGLPGALAAAHGASRRDAGDGERVEIIAERVYRVRRAKLRPG